MSGTETHSDAVIMSGAVILSGEVAHSGSKIGFYGTTPIAQATLATGASATVDDVITALQNLGLTARQNQLTGTLSGVPRLKVVRIRSLEVISVDIIYLLI